MGFGSKYTQEVNAGGGSMADNDAYKKFVKSTLMDGITSQAEYLGSYIIDAMTNRGPQGSPLWFATYAKNKYSNEVEELTGGIEEVKVAGNKSMLEVAEGLVGKTLASVTGYTIGPTTLEDIASSYVAEHYPDNASTGLWTFFVSDPDIDEGAAPTPIGKVELTIVAYKDDNLNRDDADEIPIVVTEPSNENYLTIYYTYSDPLAPSNTFISSSSNSDYKPSEITQGDYFLEEDNTTPKNVTNTTTIETIEKDEDGSQTVVDTEYIEDTVTINQGTQRYIKVIESTRFKSKYRVLLLTLSSKTVVKTVGDPPSGSGTFTKVTTVKHINTYSSSIREYEVPLEGVPAVVTTLLSNVPEISVGDASEAHTPLPLIPLRRITGGVTEKFGTKGLKKRKKRSRWQYDWITEDKEAYAGPDYNYKTLNHVVRKLFGKRIPDFVDEVKEGMDNQSKIQYMHVMYAIPLNTENHGGMKYLIEFFKKYSKNSPDALNNYKQQIAAWNSQPDASITYNPPEPPTLESLDMELKSNTRVEDRYDGRSARGGFHRKYSYKAAYGTGSGLYKDLEPNEGMIEREQPTGFDAKIREDILETKSSGHADVPDYTVAVGSRITTKNMIGMVYTIYYQRTLTEYEYVQVYDATCKSYEAWGKTVEETLLDMLGWECRRVSSGSGDSISYETVCDFFNDPAEEGDTIVTVPMYVEILRKIPVRAKGDSAYGSAMITYGVAYQGKQAGTFKKLAGMILLVIVTAITFVVSGPGAAFVAMALSGLVMVGFMDKIIKFVADILSALGIPESVARQIAAVVVTIVVMVLSGGVDTSSLMSMASAGLSATSAAMNAKFSYEAELLEKEAQAFASEAEEIQKELDSIEEELTKIGMPNYDLGNFFDSSNNIDLSTSGLKAFESLSDSLSLLRASAADSIEFDRALNQHFILIEKSLFQTISSNMVDVHYSK